jgi:hypothetical protein
MGSFRLVHLLEYVTGRGLFMGVLWTGLALFTLGLCAMMLTRWGQSQPLRKCLALSLLAHLLMFGYSTTKEIVLSTVKLAEEQGVPVSLDDGRQPASEADDAASGSPAGVSPSATAEKPWQSLGHGRVARPKAADLNRAGTPETWQVERRTSAQAAGLPTAAPLGHLGPADAVAAQPGTPVDRALAPKPAAGKAAETIDAPKAQRREGPRPLVPLRPGPDRSSTASGAAAGSDAMATRTHRPDLPSSLFQGPGVLPRMSDQPATAQPENSLAKLEGASGETPRNKPAQSGGTASVDGAGPGTPGGRTMAEGGEPATPGGDSAYASASQGGRMAPPSVASVGGKYVPGGGDGIPGGPGGAIGLPLPALPLLSPMERPGSGRGTMPEIYKLRVAPNRSELAAKQGATPATEEAVKAALKWLAANQEADGRWDARRHGAGRELMVGGRDREGAGTKADTGMTGLALLAFLARGHTHLEGDYQTNVRLGLEYLLRSQGSDGSLGGQATTFAFMYSHAMATLAVSEAYAMTKDQRLRDPVRRAVAYTMAAQNATSGGWRYKPGDPGDTSQLGWQLMALKSADLGGIPIPERTRKGIERFLKAVSSGDYGGMAAYRPGEAASRAMTAEALVCRQFLGAKPDHPASREAGDYVLGDLPGQGEANYYYWYYATLGMYQLQGVHWRQWNDALQTTLVAGQQKSGPLAGSWDPSDRWGGYGGRIYSTALATLCLEVYYRFLPLYADVAPADSREQ